MTEIIKIVTRERTELRDITRLVSDAVRKSGGTDGACLVYTPHTTAAILINENADPDVAEDIAVFLDKLVPCGGDFRHREGNSDAHIKSCLCGNSKTVIVENGDLKLGRWEGIYLAEFDGPRTREVWVKMLEGA